MRRGLFDFIRDQFSTQQPVVKADLTGKTVIVLGANTGLGFEAAKHFATMSPGRLILACRNPSKGQAAVDKLAAATGYVTAELWILDLADFASVKAFADKFEREGGRLDFLVENAAMYADKYEPTKDGWETAFQISCLSTPLLAFLLLPAMLKTAREHSTLPRLVVVSSEVHYWASIEKDVRENPDILKTLGSAEYCTPIKMVSRYLLIKLLNVFFVRALNAHLPPATPLIVNAISPGLCRSELTSRLTGIAATFDRLMTYFFAYSTEVGSRHLVWAALAEEEHPDVLRGVFIHISKVAEPSDFVISEEGAKTQDRIWDELVDILGQVDPRVTVTVQQCLSPSAV
ncbi:NAD(P)-binding protein [Mycena galopus ATCC 62051]|nr:NAD(P)-binding protein [Mycena galopus ATCC 62051]